MAEKRKTPEQLYKQWVSDQISFEQRLHSLQKDQIDAAKQLVDEIVLLVKEKTPPDLLEKIEKYFCFGEKDLSFQKTSFSEVISFEPGNSFYFLHHQPRIVFDFTAEDIDRLNTAWFPFLLFSEKSQVITNIWIIEMQRKQN